jgi:hypothetical protein
LWVQSHLQKLFHGQHLLLSQQIGLIHNPIHAKYRKLISEAKNVVCIRFYCILSW